MNCLIMIISSDNYINEQDRIAQQVTWVNRNTNFRILWLRGNTKEFSFEKNILRVPCIESNSNILKKTILGFQWALNNIEFDFLIRVNVSTYLNLDKLYNYLLKLPSNQNVAYGYPEITNRDITYGKSIEFLSGACLIFTRQAVISLINSEYKSFMKYPDDVAISMLLRQMNCKLSYISRNNLSVTFLFIPNFYIRAKSSEISTLTAKRMLYIHEYYSTSGWLNKMLAYLNGVFVEINHISKQPIDFKTYIYRCLVVLKQNLKIKFKNLSNQSHFFR